MQRFSNDCSTIGLFVSCLLSVSFPLLLMAEEKDKDLQLIPENIALLDESLLWDKSFEVRAGVGYKDNVLLRHLDPQGSPFVASGLDVSVIRLPMDGLQFYFFLTADDNRYWHEVGVDKEETVIGVAEVKKNFGNDWQAGFALEYAYQNQILDVSSEGYPGTARVQGHRVSPRPFLRRERASHSWLQLELVAQRQFFRAPLDNWWQVGPKLSLGFEYGHHSEVSFGYLNGRLLYDTRMNATADGTPIAGSSLELFVKRMEFEWRHYWDAAKRWRTTTKLAFDDFEDNGSGYYSFYRYAASEELRFQTKTWTVSGRLSASRYDFPVQPANPGNPPADSAKFNKTLLGINLRAERKLGKSFKVFGEYEHEQSLSNQPFDRYVVNAVSGGVAWDF